MKTVTATVEMSVDVPDDTPADVIECLTFDIPLPVVRVDGPNGPLVGAVVTGYTTGLVE